MIDITSAQNIDTRSKLPIIIYAVKQRWHNSFRPIEIGPIITVLVILLLASDIQQGRHVKFARNSLYFKAIIKRNKKKWQRKYVSLRK